MQLDLKNVKVTYTVREILAVLMVIGGIAGSYIRTEIANAKCQAQIAVVQQELDKCTRTIATYNGGISHN